MKQIKKFLKTNKIAIMIELFSLLLIVVIFIAIYTKQYYENKERLQVECQQFETNLKQLEYNDPTEYLAHIYYNIKDVNCFIDSKQYCAVAYEVQDMYNKTILSSKDTPITLYSTYLECDSIYIPLTGYLSKNELKDFCDFIYSDTYNKNFPVADVNAKKIQGYYDDEGRLIPLLIEQFNSLHNRTFTIANESLLASIETPIVTLETPSNSESVNLPSVSSEFCFIYSTDSAINKAWNFFDTDKLPSNEVGFHLTLTSPKTDAELFVLIDVTDYTLHMPSFIKSCVGLFICVQLLALMIIFLYSYRSSQLRKNAEMKQLFLNAMAHEMKTPIAVTVNCIECINTKVDPEKDERYLSIINEEVLRLNKLLESMLTYTRVTNSEYSLYKNQLSLKELVLETINHFSTIIEQKNIHIEYDIASDFCINADEKLIRMVLDNYISNATRHCTIGGNITININSHYFSVINDGKTIDGKNLNKIWEPLFKEDSSRSDSEGTSGMGLAISAEILKLHHLEYGVNNHINRVEFYIKASSKKSFI